MLAFAAVGGRDGASALLGRLSRLLRDVRAELAEREDMDRAALEDKMKAMAADAGFDPEMVRISTKRRGRPRKANGHDETRKAGETT